MRGTFQFARRCREERVHVCSGCLHVAKATDGRLAEPTVEKLEESQVSKNKGPTLGQAKKKKNWRRDPVIR